MAGRPRKLITEEMLQKIEYYASRGLHECQIVKLINVGQSWFTDKKKEHPELQKALDDGIAKGVAHVAKKLYENIDNGNVSAQIFYLKTKGGWKESHVLEGPGQDGNAIKVESTVKLDAQALLSKAMDNALGNKSDNKE